MYTKQGKAREQHRKEASWRNMFYVVHVYIC